MIKSYVYPLKGNIIVMKGIFFVLFFKIGKKKVLLTKICYVLGFHS